MANITISTMLATTAALALAACGGGGGTVGASNTPPSTTPPPQQPQTPTFTKIFFDGAGVYNTYSSTSPTSGSMPLGTATYEGAALFRRGFAFTTSLSPNAIQQIVNTPEFVGSASLSVNFGTNSLSGQIQDIRHSGGQPANGSIAIGGGSITGNVMSAVMSGTLATPNTTGSVTGAIDASFYGNSAQTIIGTFTGSAGSDPFVGVLAVDQ